MKTSYRFHIIKQLYAIVPLLDGIPTTYPNLLISKNKAVTSHLLSAAFGYTCETPHCPIGHQYSDIYVISFRYKCGGKTSFMASCK